MKWGEKPNSRTVIALIGALWMAPLFGQPAPAVPTAEQAQAQAASMLLPPTSSAQETDLAKRRAADIKCLTEEQKTELQQRGKAWAKQAMADASNPVAQQFTAQTLVNAARVSAQQKLDSCVQRNGDQGGHAGICQSDTAGPSPSPGISRLRFRTMMLVARRQSTADH